MHAHRLPASILAAVVEALVAGRIAFARMLR
jgi:hypothetical protein